MTEPSKNGTDLAPQVLTGTVLSLAPPLPPAKALRLTSVRACRRELAVIYAATKSGQLASADAARMTFVLMSIAKLVEISAIEARVGTLERALEGGNDGAP